MSVEKKETLIQVQNLTKTFGGSVHALNGVSTDIKKGEVVCVIGPSGSGKSTFLRCLNRLEDPTDGRIIFAGEDLMDPKTDIDMHRQKMGMVFQHFNLFPHMSILKNMTIAPMKLQKRGKDEAEGQAMKLLERVGLADRANAYPSQLSGGQKQRIAIVRALCRKSLSLSKKRSQKGRTARRSLQKKNRLPMHLTGKHRSFSKQGKDCLQFTGVRRKI